MGPLRLMYLGPQKSQSFRRTKACRFWQRGSSCLNRFSRSCSKFGDSYQERQYSPVSLKPEKCRSEEHGVRTFFLYPPPPNSSKRITRSPSISDALLLSSTNSEQRGLSGTPEELCQPSQAYRSLLQLLDVAMISESSKRHINKVNA